MPAFGRIDERAVAALRQAIAEAEQASSRTVGFFIWRAGELLDEQHGAGVVPLPSRRTWYRLFAELSAGLHTTGSAATRRSVASRPVGAFGQVSASAPGELIQMDSTPLDVLVLLADGVTGRCELTGMVDVATRTVAAAVLRPSTKSVDACLLLARTVTPEPMRPGWPQALAMARSVLPWRRLTGLDERLEHAAARPVMVPTSIVIDHGRVFVSATFKDACRFLGINLQPSRKGTPTDKGHIESMLGSVATLFAQFVAGYTGSNPDRRGRHLEREHLWSLPELQDLLDEWIVASWQNRPHDALRDPSTPGRMFTPNQKYAALIEAAGYVPVAMSGADYVELLPTVWRSVNAYGIKIDHRTYDGPELNPLRHRSSGVAQRRNQWEVHHDPYDISRIWVRDPDGGGWITVFWRHLRAGAAPFSEMAWNHVAAGMPGAGEAEIAEAVADLLRRAHAGPAGGLDARSRRIAARTMAAAPAIAEEDEPAETDEAETQEGAPEPAHPFEFFDPWQEASRRW
ncbi:hypothetical protein GCM10009839_59160 [Catenulispora yoronensis]|uniref:Integrase catalytic domain-containing protein n=1 Tax=Catenulispora yoronensis TaxID=450799 RepID=A0ABP5GIH9_9ACTN